MPAVSKIASVTWLRPLKWDYMHLVTRSGGVRPCRSPGDDDRCSSRSLSCRPARLPGGIYRAGGEYFRRRPDAGGLLLLRLVLTVMLAASPSVPIT